MTLHPISSIPVTRPGHGAPPYEDILRSLIDMGSALARQLHEHATSGASVDLSAVAATFECVSRAVCHSILLAHDPARDPALCRATSRREVIRAVQDAIQHLAPPLDDAALDEDLDEEDEEPDIEEEIGDRPGADIIAEICRDLGLAARPGPWERGIPDDIRALCARAAAPFRPAATPPAEAS